MDPPYVPAYLLIYKAIKSMNEFFYDSVTAIFFLFYLSFSGLMYGSAICACLPTYLHSINDFF